MRTLYYEGLVPAGQVINARAEREVVELATPQREASIFGSVGPNLVAINLSDFVAQPLPQRQYVIAPILPERGLAMLLLHAEWARPWSHSTSVGQQLVVSPS